MKNEFTVGLAMQAPTAEALDAVVVYTCLDTRTASDNKHDLDLLAQTITAVMPKCYQAW